MDQAMFFHVVVDEETNLPVCGNWLFLGEDTDNPDDAYVTANFFEIIAALGATTALNQALADHLLSFTGQFAKDIGSKGLVLRPLTYGQIKDLWAK